MVFFFPSSFLPLSNRLTKALPFRWVSSLSVAHSHFLLQTHSLSPFRLSLTLPWAVCPPLPSLTPRLPPLLLPGQLFSSGSARAPDLFVSSSPSRQGSRGAHGSSLSLLSLFLSPSPVSSQGDGGAALLAVEEVRGSPGSSHSAAVCCFTVVRLHPSLPHSLCVCVCVRVAFLSPPLSLIPLFACLSWVHSVPLWAFTLLFLVLSCSSRLVVSLFVPLLVFFTSWDKVGYSFYYTQKPFLCYLARLFGWLFFPPFSPTYLFPCSPSLPSPLLGSGVCGELETLAGRATENESTKQQNASAWILEMSLKPRLVFLSLSLSLSYSLSLSLFVRK